MKRMNEVFDLPVSDMDLAYLTSQAEDGSMTFAENKRCKHAAHAINHVDALAGALEAMIKSHELVGGATSGYYAVLANAKSALEAYRGAK